MLRFYYAALSPFARPVWLMLLEKGLEFELVPMQLNGDQFEPDFVALNPFSHIPVIVDCGFRVFECLAILDYLEARYPDPPLLPTTPEALATVRMVNLTCANELIPAVGGLVLQDLETNSGKLARLRALQVLNYFEELLGDRLYLAGEAFSVAEIMAGSILATFVDMGHSLEKHPTLAAWLQKLRSRESWRKIQLPSAAYDEFRRRLRVMAKLRTKRRLQRFSHLLEATSETGDTQESS